MLKKILYFSLIGLLSACTPNHLTMDNKTNNETPKPINQTLLANKPLTAKDIIHPQGKKATSDEIAECQKQGGTISPQGLRQFDFCVVEFADKGKVCTDGSECQAGRCLANGQSFDDEVGTPVKGICPSNNVPFGCYGTINNGQLNGFLCVD